MNNRPDPDIERLVERSLDSRATQIGRQTGHIDGVYARVDHRRDRRRTIAVGGSLASVAVCIGGFVALSNWSDPAEQVTGGAPIGDPAVESPTTTNIDDLAPTELPATLGGPIQYFRFCELLAVPSQIPTTTVEGQEQALVDSVWACHDPVTVVPTPTGTSWWPYEVQTGDTLATIAARYGVGVDDIVSINGWSEGVQHSLVPGESILLPFTESAPPSTRLEPSPTWPNTGSAPIEVDCYGGTTTSAPPGYICRTPAETTTSTIPTTTWPATTTSTP